MAFKMLSAMEFKSKGLTVTASKSSFAAPAISLNIKTPSVSTLVATNSFATRFIPSLTGVIIAISEIIYNSIRSSKDISL